MEHIAQIIIDSDNAARRYFLDKLRGLPGLTRTGIEPEHFGWYCQLGLCQVKEGATDWESFGNRMVLDLGPNIRPYLGLIWEDLWHTNRGIWDQEDSAWPEGEAPLL